MSPSIPRRQHRVDVPRRPVGGALVEPRGDAGLILPIREDEKARLAQRHVEAVGGEAGEFRKAGARRRLVAGDELEGQGRHGEREALERLGLHPLHVELDEVGVSVALDQQIEGRGPHPPPAVPAHRLERRHRPDGIEKVPGARRHGGVVVADEEVDLARDGGDRGLLDDDAEAAAEDSAQEGGEVRLRLDGNDAGAEGMEGGAAVADVGADVEA